MCVRQHEIEYFTYFAKLIFPEQFCWTIADSESERVHL